MLEFGLHDEEKSASKDFRPLPAGTVVPLRLSLCESDYSVDKNVPFITATKSGLLRLHVLFEIIGGPTKGRRFYDDIVLPKQLQSSKDLNEGQQKACSVGDLILKGIILASRGENPRDSNAVAKMNSWKDLEGVTFWGELTTREYNGKVRQGLRWALDEKSDVVNQSKAAGYSVGPAAPSFSAAPAAPSLANSPAPAWMNPSNGAQQNFGRTEKDDSVPDSWLKVPF